MIIQRNDIRRLNEAAGNVLPFRRPQDNNVGHAPDKPIASYDLEQVGKMLDSGSSNDEIAQMLSTKYGVRRAKLFLSFLNGE